MFQILRRLVFLYRLIVEIFKPNKRVVYKIRIVRIILFLISH